MAISGSDSGVTSDIRRSDPSVLFADRYRMIRRLASGGMGSVYLAEQVPLGRAVAIKVMHPVSDQESERVEEFRQRFFLEASTSAKLTHPNIVTVHDYGESPQGELFLAMEYLEGCTLNSVLKAEKRLSPLRTCILLIQVCKALRLAHQAQFMHRDLKPSNIMLVDTPDEFDFVKVIDFGLAKTFAKHSGEMLELTQKGGWMGSPLFMAPEQFRNKECGPQTDIYALGVILYRCLFGKVPFRGESQIEVMEGHLRRPIPWPNESVGYPELSSVIERCLRKLPEDRYHRVDELIGDLQSIATQLPEAFESRPGSAVVRRPSAMAPELVSGRYIREQASWGSSESIRSERTDDMYSLSSGRPNVYLDPYPSMASMDSISLISVPSLRVVFIWWLGVALLGVALAALVERLMRSWW